ncbi:MAG: hypothetical protein KME45_10565 [Stenomitos rutilans HA7619-LM2]|jgi:ribosomal protein L37AE/L43A|nr:hypothetical protein [Stenomitos rutilans HA7619-LM2]
MSACPCCGEVLLRHARHTGIYWFCTHCWQEMPDLTLDQLKIRYNFSHPSRLANLLQAQSALTV